MYFHIKRQRGQDLRSYRDDARELQYKASRSDAPESKTAEQISHAAMVRAEARLAAGNTHWVAGQKWNEKEID